MTPRNFAILALALLAVPVVVALWSDAPSPAARLAERWDRPASRESAALLHPPDGQATRSKAPATPAASGPHSAGSREHLAALAAAVEAGDSEAAGDLVRAWFAEGDIGVERLWDVAAGEGLTRGDGAALGVLLKAAAYYTTSEPEVLPGWTLDALAASAVAMLGASDQVPAMLALGLDEAGPRLDGRHLEALVRGFADDPVGPVPSQVHCHQLMRSWATTMDGSAARSLAELVRDSTAGEGERAQAAAALLLRDWRTSVPELVEGLSTGEIPPSDDLAFFLGAHVHELPREDRAPYFAALGDDVELALDGAWALTSEDAALALADADAAGVAPSSRDVLAVRSADEGSLEAGLRLLDLPGTDRARASVELFVFKSWLRSDVAVDGRFLELAESRFADRATNPSRFWDLLAIDLDRLDDAHVMGAVLPFVERSRGESSAARLAVVARLEARFEGLQLD